MSKMIGPCFDFVINKDGAKIEFVFLPGNASRQKFAEAQTIILGAFKNQYGISATDYLRKVQAEDGSNTIAIYQTKVLPTLQLILGSRLFGNFKIKVTGVDKDGNEKVKIVSNPVEAKEAAEVIPYFNKRNNDMTTKRRT